MNILILTHRLPVPPDDGGRIVIFNHIRHLAARGHALTLVALSGGAMDHAQELALCEHCEPHIFVKDFRTRLGRLVANLLSEQPYTMEKYQFRDVRDFALELTHRQHFDVVIAEQLHTAWLAEPIRREGRVPVILVEHNIESRIMERFAAEARNPLVGLYARIQSRKLWAYELETVRRFGRCVAISEDEARMLRERVPELSVTTVTPGVDLEVFAPVAHVGEPALISVASMEWRPNIDGMLWFCQEVFPRIASECAGVRLYVVGKNPPAVIRDLSGPAVTVTGFVEDIRPLMGRASAFVVPLKVGGGMRIKILNAFAMGVPVVSTTIGAEGIPARDGEEILIADTPEDFAAACLALLKDGALRGRLRESARALVREHFSMVAKAAEFERVLQAACRSDARTVEVR